MKTTPQRLDAFRAQLTDTIEHGTQLLVDLKALNDSFPKLLPLPADLLAGLTTADGGEAWLRRQIDALQAPRDSSAA